MDGLPVGEEQAEAEALDAEQDDPPPGDASIPSTTPAAGRAPEAAAARRRAGVAPALDLRQPGSTLRPSRGKRLWPPLLRAGVRAGRVAVGSCIARVRPERGM
ncbi:unnamed protein product [Urochloa humidicola]